MWQERKIEEFFPRLSGLSPNAGSHPSGGRLRAAGQKRGPESESNRINIKPEAEVQ